MIVIVIIEMNSIGPKNKNDKTGDHTHWPV
jgi:hypothetical protein